LGGQKGANARKLWLRITTLGSARLPLRKGDTCPEGKGPAMGTHKVPTVADQRKKQRVGGRANGEKDPTKRKGQGAHSFRRREVAIIQGASERNCRRVALHRKACHSVKGGDGVPTRKEEYLRPKNKEEGMHLMGRYSRGGGRWSRRESNKRGASRSLIEEPISPRGGEEEEMRILRKRVKDETKWCGTANCRKGEAWCVRMSGGNSATRFQRKKGIEGRMTPKMNRGGQEKIKGDLRSGTKMQC